jgi:hypothetical protein
MRHLCETFPLSILRTLNSPMSSVYPSELIPALMCPREVHSVSRFDRRELLRSPKVMPHSHLESRQATKRLSGHEGVILNTDLTEHQSVGHRPRRVTIASAPRSVCASAPLPYSSPWTPPRRSVPQTQRPAIQAPQKEGTAVACQGASASTPPEKRPLPLPARWCVPRLQSRGVWYLRPTLGLRQRSQVRLVRHHSVASRVGWFPPRRLTRFANAH